MKLKNKLILLGILIGVISCLGLNNIQAAEITSAFSGETITRNIVGNGATISELDTTIVPITLGIAQSEYKTNNGEAYWSIKDSNGVYKDLYCLNLSRGFGAPYGNITNANSTKNYTNQYNLNTISDTDYLNYTGLSTTNKNKILWILNNSVTSTEDLNTILAIASKKVDIQSVGLTDTDIEKFVKEDMASNTRPSTKLTFDDIKIVQQIAIWHYTNNTSVFENTLSGICNSEGKQISGLMNEKIDIDGFGTYVWNGKIKQAKLNALYKYFVDGAESTTSETKIPTLTLLNTNVKVVESGDSYIVGPFLLEGTNKELIKEIQANVNVEYKLLNASQAEIASNDFSKVIGNNFYLKISKNKINKSTNISINLTYKYNKNEVTLLTDINDPMNTQAVGLVRSEEKENSVRTIATIKLTNVILIKHWEDNNNQDGKRPENIKVQLYANNKKVGNPVTLNKSNIIDSSDVNTWAHSWENLLELEAGKKYEVKELNEKNEPISNNGKNADYTVSYEYIYQEGIYETSGESENGVHNTGITNEYMPETMDISGTKTWKDNENQDGKRPEEITVNLLADGTEIKEVKVTAANDWKYSFTDLPKYEAGREIEYKITEDTVAEYTTTINKYDITNEYIPEVVEKTVTKIWVDNENQDGIRPNKIEVTLYKTVDTVKEEVETIELEASKSWTYTWKNLAKYENGKEIVYSVAETIPDNYTVSYSEDTFVITNTYTPGKTSKKVIKVWDDNENQDGLRPENVMVQLYANNNVYGTPIELNEENSFSYTWMELPLKENGTKIIYSVREVEVPAGYTEEYSAVDYSQTSEITITNRYTPGVTNKKVIKNWVDNNDQDKLRPESVEVQLYKTVGDTRTSMGEDYKVVLNEENNWAYTWNGLAVKENKTEIIYSVEEIEVPEDYTVSYSSVDYSETNEIIITNTHIPNKFDLSLRKFITKVNDTNYSREPVVDTSKLGTVVNGEKVTTATYKHSKEPIAVQRGDVVTYTIRVYNEGEVDGYVDSITDYLPEHLLPIIIGVDGIDEEKYVDEIEFNVEWGWIALEDDRTVTTTKTSSLNSDTYSLIDGCENITDTKLEAYVEGSDKLDYIDVQIKCLVTDSAVGGEYLTNIAEITDSKDINSNKGDGFDSDLWSVDYSNLSDYKNSEAINSTKESYIPGQEDDDDFEKLVVKEFDLSLRKFIVKVNETTHSREPVVDTSKLGTVVNGKTITTATYVHTKEPVIVETSDVVTYKIRIYNEGTIAGFANEITDDIPEGVEFLPDSDINVSYRWKMLDKDGEETEDVTKAVMITTDYLSNRDANNIIREVSERDGVKTLNYKDVEVQFKVIAKAEKLQENLIINEAQISADSDRDIDSDPNRDEKYDYTTGKNEDDIDYEPIKLQYFDLALRKFITKVNSTDYNNRYPEIKFNDDGSITYNHTKDPVLVSTGDTVIYTIRVYNEGEKAGYATEIKDNLPEGLAFDPNNEVNKTYGWKMIDKEGNVTEEAEKVVAFKTSYLEKEKIEALEEKEGLKVLDYKDVQIAFIVTESNTSDRILVNTAQISADSDDDIDSTPDNSVETEDDIDKEYVKVQYFDLALKKWVTETRVTLDGKTTSTKTGFTEDSEGIAKVDIVASKLKKTTVKFVYNIKITNEGELPGYAYEIKDYIPSGLKFVAEDNKDWKEEKDNVVVTDQLKDTLLNPGESATVEIVLTWKNSSTNLGLKTNYAEISNDSADDIDSTPDNYDFTEDDIDDAQVILSIKTAGKTTYIGLVLISVTILAGGIFLIKKYVLDI